MIADRVPELALGVMAAGIVAIAFTVLAWYSIVALAEMVVVVLAHASIREALKARARAREDRARRRCGLKP